MTVAIPTVALAVTAGPAAAPAHPAGQRASWPGAIAYEADAILGLEAASGNVTAYVLPFSPGYGR
jgi:hypothetical protein